MKRHAVSVACLAILFLVSPLSLLAQPAQPKIDPAAERIAPLLKENTFLVVHIDLTRIDSDAIFDMVDKLMVRLTTKMKAEDPAIFDNAAEEKMLRDQAGMGRDMLKQVIADFKKSEVNEIFVLSSMEDQWITPFVLLLPTTKELDPSLVVVIQSTGLSPIGKMGDFYAFIQPAALPMPSDSGNTSSEGAASAAPTTPAVTAATMFKTAGKKKRPALAAGLDLQKKSPIRIVFAPSEGMKGIAYGALPMVMQQAPKEIDPKAISAVIKNTESVSLGITPEEPRLTFAIQTDTEAKAKVIASTLAKVIDVLEKTAAAPPVPPTGAEAGPGMPTVVSPFMLLAGADWDSVRQSLPIQKGDRLVQVFDNRTIDKYEDTIVTQFSAGYRTGKESAKRFAEQFHHNHEEGSSDKETSAPEEEPMQ